MNRKPKFKVGDTVTHRRDLYGLTESVVTEIERVFKRVDKNGEFEQRGLCTMESDIKNIKIPYTFDGQTLVVDYGNEGWVTGKSTAKFYGYSYVTKNDKMNTIWPEKSLKLKRQ